MSVEAILNFLPSFDVDQRGPIRASSCIDRLDGHKPGIDRVAKHSPDRRASKCANCRPRPLGSANAAKIGGQLSDPCDNLADAFAIGGFAEDGSNRLRSGGLEFESARSGAGASFGVSGGSKLIPHRRTPPGPPAISDQMLLGAADTLSQQPHFFLGHTTQDVGDQLRNQATFDYAV
jgi:hypothetical protein